MYAGDIMMFSDRFCRRDGLSCAVFTRAARNQSSRIILLCSSVLQMCDSLSYWTQAVVEPLKEGWQNFNLPYQTFWSYCTQGLLLLCVQIIFHGPKGAQVMCWDGICILTRTLPRCAVVVVATVVQVEVHYVMIAGVVTIVVGSSNKQHSR